MEKIILASQSPRRRELLQLANIPFEIITADTDESFPPGLSQENTAIHIAENKARGVKEKVPNRTILAADTIVVCEDQIIGKPKNREDAIGILTKLSGNTHTVITGVAIIKDNMLSSFADVTKVSFHPLAFAQITYYIDTYKPYDKAGAYAIQEWIGAVGIKSIEGDFYNVMGLPISRVVQFLQGDK